MPTVYDTGAVRPALWLTDSVNGAEGSHWERYDSFSMTNNDDTTTAGRSPFVAALTAPGALAVLWLGTAVLGRWTRAPMSTEILALVLLVAYSLRFVSRHEDFGRHKRLLLLCLTPIAALFISSVLADHPSVALLGGEPLRQGWLLWAVLYLWFAYSLVLIHRRDMVACLRVLAVAGTASSVWALAQAAGILSLSDVSAATPMALLDNPNSLAQALIVTLGATVGMFSLTFRSQGARIAVGLSIVLQLMAIRVTNSWAALGAVAPGVVFFALQRAVTRRSRRVLAAAASATLVAALGVFVALMLASSGALGAAPLRSAEALLSGRPHIWEAANERVLESPLIGVGPSDFQSITRWGVSPDGDLFFVLTTDPHGIAFDWLVASGFLGFAAFAVGALAIALSLARVASRRESSLCAHVLTSTAAAAGFAMLVSWPEPIALFSVTTIVGGLIGMDARAAEPSRIGSRRLMPVLLPALGVSLAAIAGLVLLVPPYMSELSTLHARWSSVRAEVFAISAQQRSTGDPYYQDEMYDAVMSPGDSGLSDLSALSLVEELDAEYETNADTDDVELPLTAAEILWIRRDALSADEFWGLTGRFVSRGREADPTLTVWDFLLARAAVAVGRPDARDYVDTALAGDKPGEGSEEALRRWSVSLEQ